MIGNLDWLSLFGKEPLARADSKLDILSERLQEKLYYRTGEKDMILLRHRFIVENADRSMKTITSTLIDFGIPHGDSSMSRTVSLPMAMGIQLMAEEKIRLTGVQIPIKKEIYLPVLDGIEKLGLKMKETTALYGIAPAP
ncbi:MAG: hypothetical protein CSA23_00565 [Deltaproteobacteria bacterium]|nr:MAG: hypothetical protein CSA23_00565 [Deltaproteobacteria bacterium]